jgi:hypothetical protein
VRRVRGTGPGEHRVQALAAGCHHAGRGPGDQGEGIPQEERGGQVSSLQLAGTITIGMLMGAALAAVAIRWVKGSW